MQISEWQPIATAPKDGTDVLIVFDYGPAGCIVQTVTQAYWSDEVFWQPEGDYGPAWVIYDCEDPHFSQLVSPEAATHWMPLPAPPAK